ncbi:MAG TPA: alpha/beta hydrolase [bacterium]|nr:alpha/beta hydrolase [bacterium]HPP30520.1 alpha/beta hydrolase [bacterium]
MKTRYCIPAITFIFCINLYSQQVPSIRQTIIPENVKVIKNIVYAKAGDTELLMDIYIPEGKKEPSPLVVWIHGGAWKSGSKENCYPALSLLKYGYAVASINYRLTGLVNFPAEIEDCKSAIRFLRANAEKYNIAPDRIGVWGASAGGHLAALLGTTGKIKKFDKGDYLEFSSNVQAVCDYFGPSYIPDMSNKISLDVENAPEEFLVRRIPGKAKKAEEASPLNYVSKDASPFFIVHGDKDNVVPVSQSEMLYNALLKAGVPVQMEIIKGAGHGGPEFVNPGIIEKVVSFFDRYLKGN